jgi:hypothetical protein
MLYKEIMTGYCKNHKSNPIRGLDRPWVFQEVEAPRFQENRHMKLVRLSALGTGRLYPQGNMPGTHFSYRLSQPQGQSATGRMMSMNNSCETFGNRTRDLPTCKNQMKINRKAQPQVPDLIARTKNGQLISVLLPDAVAFQSFESF